MKKIATLIILSMILAISPAQAAGWKAFVDGVQVHADANGFIQVAQSSGEGEGEGEGTVTYYNLNTNASPGGHINQSPAGISQAEGTVVTLTAVADSGYDFTTWSGDTAQAVINTNTLTVTMTGDKTIGATFTLQSGEGEGEGEGEGTVTYYNLTINSSAGGHVTQSPEGISQAEGTVVTLTAVADKDRKFTGWSGAVSGTTSPMTVTMTTDKTVTATFVPIVPNLSGMATVDALSALIEAGLTVGTDTLECSDTITANHIVSQSPIAGTEVTLNSAVNIVISSGACPVNPTKPVAIPAIDPASETLNMHIDLTAATDKTFAHWQGSVAQYLPKANLKLMWIEVYDATNPEGIARQIVLNASTGLIGDTCLLIANPPSLRYSLFATNTIDVYNTDGTWKSTVVKYYVVDHTKWDSGTAIWQNDFPNTGDQGWNFTLPDVASSYHIDTASMLGTISIGTQMPSSVFTETGTAVIPSDWTGINNIGFEYGNGTMDIVDVSSSCYPITVELAHWPTTTTVNVRLVANVTATGKLIDIVE